jgi:hypothetical protein
MAEIKWQTAHQWGGWTLAVAILLPLSSGCFVAQAPGGTSVQRSQPSAVRLASTGTVSACGGGLTGVITATASSGPLPGVSQFLCASTAIAPPFNGPDAASGGSGQTFSFALNSTLAPTLNNTMTFFIVGNSPGAYDLSTLNNYVLFGYTLSSGYCPTITGNITVTSLGFGTAAGTFTATGLCDSTGAAQYSSVSGSFHIP